MTYKQTLEFLFQKLPMYQRIGKAAYRADLGNITALLENLDNPHHELRCIHIAGTNGKGSVAHLLASIMQESGYRTGLYTSPHLRDFRERIKVNGKMIPQQDVVRFVEEYRDTFCEINPSFFEITVAMAFDHFCIKQADISCIEVGLGGRLDATNVIDPEVSIITHIGLDHEQFLGNTIEKIAAEKAGIIKPGRAVVVGKCVPSVREVITEIALEKGATTYFTEDFDLKPPPTPLRGEFQRENMKTAMLALGVLGDRGWKVSEENARKGAKRVLKNTKLKGRWQKIGTQPLTFCDVAHNEAGLKEVINLIESTPHENLWMVLGTVSDKNMDSLIKILPKEAYYILCEANVPRAMPAGEMSAYFKKHDIPHEIISKPMDALQSARNRARAKDLVFIGGSTFVVAEVI